MGIDQSRRCIGAINRLTGPPEGGDMLSKEDSRRLAQLERQLRRDDPEFCARMAGGRPPARRVPLSLVLAAAVIWGAALVLAVAGWWIAAGVAAVWAMVIVGALAYRCGPSRHGRHRPGDPEPLPPGW
jgi:predicted signal transduction protein with EAL and GGDEF domain